MKYYCSLLQKIIIVIFFLIVGYQVGSLDSVVCVYFFSMFVDEILFFYEFVLFVERIGDLVWCKIICDILCIGNFVFYIYCDIVFFFQVWVVMKDCCVFKFLVWEEQVLFFVLGYEFYQVY